MYQRVCHFRLGEQVPLSGLGSRKAERAGRLIGWLRQNVVIGTYSNVIDENLYI